MYDNDFSREKPPKSIMLNVQSTCIVQYTYIIQCTLYMHYTFKLTIPIQVWDTRNGHGGITRNL